ncbi:LLM class flavin-dependent oxidoreductase [Micromonospora sp. WMMD812]|uniref:LLM class flavin-dependent oxidoreductase n=1 Tax=Micromonospora sp. WMMD812 TaxID=3015152 RepID=UPI00248B1134|nr:LLM class flavin-dependent oxidoreductase [Micromonospora sp. WMMD812]WBB67084.1 LLM class flavin-dependent oxidoreductase [Micromonospora sp. WMMD812]
MPRYAVGLPNVGPFADARTLVDLAVAAEEHGWDGVFLWDHLLYHDPDWPLVNTVVVASAIAARTSRIRLGVLVTALPRRRVQTVARETATLDTLSGGRLVVGAGIGSMDAEYAAFGEDPDLRARGRRLDESLAQLTALWSGRDVAMPSGHAVRMLPTPVQQPRIPV